MKKDEVINLTILIPALNEEKTIGICLDKANKFIKENNIKAEVLVIDNNSTDKTEEIALTKGARIENVKDKGYGNALQKGIKSANGRFIIMADADDSYNFLEILPIYKSLLEGYDFVIGNRFSGNIEKGAMKTIHQYLGTPFISFLGRKLYNIQVKDFNCGLRGFKTKKIRALNCKSKGMEFATEMIIKAKKFGLTMKEIPINFYKDKRGCKSHLNTFKDGLRHLKIIIELYR